MQSLICGVFPISRVVLLGGTAAFALVSPGAAWAHEVDQPAANVPPAATDEAQPATDEAQPADDAPVGSGNEIVVTATKREQTLQNVPVAVTVTTAETIERAQIRDLKDLSSVVPSLRISQLQSSANTNFFIRGFGNGANNAGIEPSVGVFIDGVYRSRSAAQIGDLPDVQRIEVLRGPQSTLFGKNASAGVISIVTREPQFSFGGNLEASYGNLNAVVLKGVVTGPVSDDIALSLAGGLDKRDGYIRNPVTGNDINNRNRWFVRGQALFDNHSNLKVRLIGDYDKIDERCCSVVNAVPSAVTALITAPVALGGLGGQVNAPNDRFSKAYSNFDSTNNIENYGVSGQADYDLGLFKLTSITAYRGTNAVTNQDSDFTSADILQRNYQDLRIRTFTQELRLNASVGPVNFLLGGYYFNEKIDQANQVQYGTQFRPFADAQIRAQSGGAFTLAQVEQLLGATQGNPGLYAGQFFAPGTGLNEAYRLKDESFSIFSQVDFKIADRLTLTGGINYTRDTKHFATDTTSSDLFASLPLGSFVGPATQVLIAQNVGAAIGAPGGFATPAQIGAFAANPAAAPIFAAISAGSAAAAGQLTGLRALQIFPPFLNVPNAIESGRIADHNFSYTARLSYDATNHINLYLSYATGYKPPSVNLSRDSRPTAADLVLLEAAGLGLPNLTAGSRYAASEKSTVYEAGMKADWGVVSANVAVFKQSIKNFQSNIFTGLGFFLGNADKQSTWGFEFEGVAKPAAPLTLSLALTYLNPKYDKFTNSAFGDASGTTPADVPPLSVTFGAQWDQPVGHRGDHLILRGDFHYEAPSRPIEGFPGLIPLIGAQGAQDAAQQFKFEVNELDASATYAMANGLELTVWGRNLLDDRFLIQAFDSPAQVGSISGYPNQPRTYGASVRFRW